MDFKKRKDFTPRKEDRTFSKRRKSKSINKEPFPVSLFVYFFVSLFKRRKDSALVKFYNTAVRLLEHLQEKYVIETIISNNIKISSCFANDQAEIHLE